MEKIARNILEHIARRCERTDLTDGETLLAIGRYALELGREIVRTIQDGRELDSDGESVAGDVFRKSELSHYDCRRKIGSGWGVAGESIENKRLTSAKVNAERLERLQEIAARAKRHGERVELVRQYASDFRQKRGKVIERYFPELGGYDWKGNQGERPANDVQRRLVHFIASTYPNEGKEWGGNSLQRTHDVESINGQFLRVIGIDRYRYGDGSGVRDVYPFAGEVVRSTLDRKQRKGKRKGVTDCAGGVRLERGIVRKCTRKDVGRVLTSAQCASDASGGRGYDPLSNRGTTFTDRWRSTVGFDAKYRQDTSWILARMQERERIVVRLVRGSIGIYDASMGNAEYGRRVLRLFRVFSNDVERLESLKRLVSVASPCQVGASGVVIDRPFQVGTFRPTDVQGAEEIRVDNGRQWDSAVRRYVDNADGWKPIELCPGSLGVTAWKVETLSPNDDGERVHWELGFSRTGVRAIDDLFGKVQTLHVPVTWINSVRPDWSEESIARIQRTLLDRLFRAIIQVVRDARNVGKSVAQVRTERRSRLAFWLELLRSRERVSLQDSYAVGNCQAGTAEFCQRLGIVGSSVSGGELARAWKRAGYPEDSLFIKVLESFKRDRDETLQQRERVKRLESLRELREAVE